MHKPGHLIKRHFILAVFLATSLLAQAQSPAFFHLSTAEGLSDNNVYTVARDRNGIVWIGTGEGLNSFDGNRITTYYKQQHPELSENSIARILVNDENIVWIRTSGHYLTALDEKRRFHKILIGNTADQNGIGSIFHSKKNGLIVLKGTAHYFQQGKTLRFEKKKLPFESKLSGAAGFTYFLDNDKVVYYRNSRLFVINYNTLELELDYLFPGLIAASNINDDELLLFTNKDDVFYRFSISQEKIIKEYRHITDQHNMPVTGTLRVVTRIDSSRFAFTTYFAGLYTLNLHTQSLEHWEHDPINPRSIGGNNTMNIKYDTSGYLFVTTQTSGLHFYHLKQQQAFSVPYFMNEAREIFDGYIQSIVTDKKDNVWMGAQDRLIKWERKTGKTAFIPIRLPDGTNISGSETIRVVNTDDNGNLWVGTSRYGIYVFDDNLNNIGRLTDSSQGRKTGLPSNFINALCHDNNGNWWVGTPGGICIVDKTNLKATSPRGHPVLSPLANINCTDLWEDENGDIWAGSYKGVWHYNKSANKLVNYSTKEGLPSNIIEAINKDNLGNYYFATQGGLSVLSKDGKILTYTRSNGLRNDRCEGILKDENGYMWIGNLNCILRFDPSNKTFTVFEESYGFSHGGYRMRCAHITQKGEMFWGTDKGLVYFFPEQMSASPLPLHPSIHTLQAGNNNFHFTAKDKISFPYNTSSFVFHFSSGELSGDRKNQFRSRLKGFDDDWKMSSAIGQAVYSQLPPGHYSFEIKASRDGINWYSSSYPVEIIIEKPWWKQTWFRLLCLAVAAGVTWFIYSHLQKRRKSKMEVMELNVKMAESRFSNLRLQMNPHFLFNSLSSIQHLIVSQQNNRAYKYLTVFSNFLRSLLNYAEKNFIPLDEEIKILKMYIELESLRFDQSFSWDIQTDEHLTNDEVLVPTLMIQPFVENAIWHGLMHKEGKKNLSIHFQNSSEEYLTCTVEDNGVGRDEATRIKQGKITSMVHESKGIHIIRERLKLLEQKTGKPARLEMQDLYNDKQEASGTRVIITIPYYNPEES